MIAEAVSYGHPDKVADIIADAIVDAYLAVDQEAILGVKTLVSRDLVVVSGEIGSNERIDIEHVVRDCLLRHGFDGERETWDSQKTEVRLAYNDVRHELDDPENTIFFEQGAADTCFVTGYACKETPQLFPAAPILARALIQQLGEVRTHIPYLRADAKSLVEIAFDDDTPFVKTAILSTEHEPGFSVKKLREDVQEQVIVPTLGALVTKNTVIVINPLGQFEKAGVYAETGLSGRKIVVDQYGSAVAIGGGAFSGKDPSKLDRAGAYYARYVAKSVIAANLADDCTVTLAYGIGMSRPLCVKVIVDGKISRETDKIVQENFHFTPRSIIQQLGLLHLSYEDLAKNGHLARDGLPWEKPRPLL